MIERIGATVRMATREGVSQARIELRPADLGHVAIRLVQSGDGLRARITADTPAAAQALVQGRGELTQALGALKVSLLGLDIGFSGQPAPGDGGERFAGGAQAQAGTAGRDKAGELESPADEAQQSPQARGRELGEIVDVFA